MSDLTALTVAELQRALADGETSAAEVTRAHLDRIATEDGALGAYLHVDHEGALRRADEVPPTTHAVPMTNVFRPDVVTPSLDRDVVLAEAPAAEDGRFRVPRILGEEE